MFVLLIDIYKQCSDVHILILVLKTNVWNRVCGKLSVNIARSISNTYVTRSPASSGVSTHMYCWCCPCLVPSSPASCADTAHRRLLGQITAQALYPFMDYTPQ